MSMDAGDETVQAGTMARAIFDELESLVDPSLSGAEARKRVAAAVARGVVSHIAANADVTITTSDEGLQQVSGTDTDAPSTNKTLSGAVS